MIDTEINDFLPVFLCDRKNIWFRTHFCTKFYTIKLVNKPNFKKCQEAHFSKNHKKTDFFSNLQTYTVDF